MKTHMILAIWTLFFLTGCASYEGRDISSTQENKEGQRFPGVFDGNFGSDFSRGQ